MAKSKEITAIDIEAASSVIAGISKHTALEFCERLSEKHLAKIYFKREDTQVVRSYKVRGAYNLIATLPEVKKKKGIVCASAGNHAQGVALSAKLLHIKATIFMPEITPLQKINRVKNIGNSWVQIRLVGRTFDECDKKARDYCKKTGAVYVSPFNDSRIIAGQGTVAKEIYDELGSELDILLCPIGGGGLVSGALIYLSGKPVSVIGVEPEGAAAMHEALKLGKVVPLQSVDTFVDGAAVKEVGDLTFSIVQNGIYDLKVVPVGKICTSMIELYQNEGIIAEPAGALSVAALDSIAEKIKGKTVVCVISGGNNDILRYPEVLEKSLVYLGLRHYLLLEFAQKPGQLRAFLDNVLGPTDDIIRFEYLKKSSKEKGAALVGIELQSSNDLQPILIRMKQIGLTYRLITNDDILYSHLI